MNPLLIGVGLLAAALASLWFSTLTYSLREFSRARLADYLERRRKSRFLQPTLEYLHDLAFATAACRLLANVLVLLSMLRLLAETSQSRRLQYFLATLATLAITLVVSVAAPHALARYAGHAIVGASVRFLQLLRWVLAPLIQVMHWTDDLVRRAASGGAEAQAEGKAEQIEEDILSAVEEGEKEGLVDEAEREMIESVIGFGDRTVGQIMTPRPEIIALEDGVSLEEVKKTLEATGLSRVPIYQGNLDHMVGILYARDLLQYVGLPAERVDLRKAIRPPYFVPETKPLDDLLRDFRLQKVHIAIVLDEYGGTAGLVTIEDVLEELVGDISDEHEPLTPLMLKRLDESHYEADARILLEELNESVGLSLPEDAGYDTLGGYVTVTLGRIPPEGTSFEANGAKFTILDAEPARVNRVRIELRAKPSEGVATTANLIESATAESR